MIAPILNVTIEMNISAGIVSWSCFEFCGFSWLENFMFSIGECHGD